MFWVSLGTMLALEKVDRPVIWDFLFSVSLGPARGRKQRGAVVVDPKPPKRSNPLSDTCRRIGTFVPQLLDTSIALKLTMLHRESVISIKLIKLKFEAQRNRNSSVSTYAT
jgi:hypothetical protein